LAIAFEAVAGTGEDQVAVAPGALCRTWTEGSRRYFRYVTDAPIGNEYAIVSANYAVREAQWGDVAIRIFDHPQHANLHSMVRGIQASLDYYPISAGRQTTTVTVPRRPTGAGIDPNRLHRSQDGRQLRRSTIKG
jgi:hypothetical protein